MIEPGKRCYCESRGEVVYVDRDSTGRHPAVAKLPRHEFNLKSNDQRSIIFSHLIIYQNFYFQTSEIYCVIIG